VRVDSKIPVCHHARFSNADPNVVLYTDHWSERRANAVIDRWSAAYSRMIPEAVEKTIGPTRSSLGPSVPLFHRERMQYEIFLPIKGKWQQEYDRRKAHTRP
jgi:hypothetical protein